MIPRLDSRSFANIAARTGLPSADFEALKPVLETVLTIIDPLMQDRSEPAPLVDQSRSPSPSEDPFNAFVRRCEIPPTGSGLLNGARIAVKDAIAVAGVLLTGGSTLLQDLIPSQHSTVVQRVLDAGATIVGLTNMDAFGFSGGGESSSFGPTLNQLDTARSAGGSSSGSAAALHYSDIDLTIGADQGGSVRIPASWCGVIGLKPTHGLVPYTGAMGIDATFDHLGPMARTVEDIAKLLTVIAGPDGVDPRQARTDGDLWTRNRDYLHAVRSAPDTLAGIRIGVLTEATGDGVVAREVDESFVRTLGRLKAIGASVGDVSEPAHAALGPVAFAVFVEGMAALLNAGGNGHHWRGRYVPEFAAALRSGLDDRAEQLSPQVQVAIILGEWLRQHYRGEVYARAQNDRQRLRDSYSTAFDSVDLLIMPTVPSLPHRLDDELDLSARVLRGWDVLTNTSPTDMTGHPAITLPIDTADGLPCGTMLVGPHGSEEALLSAAATIEKTLGLHTPSFGNNA
ncbi:amidase [Curtobacterium sp. PhB142]|uniref:amidase family protein n=1 Tax=unclassified Curtobacterium TaxID=257496 RepID=UPI0010532758|nr:MULTISPECIES: amidase family protein [unclassified Curtobacterium]TCL77943.1 amidase [Curtobacterium sp. PhB142]TCL98391.1 amidase [Curtobacterium sp. PhB134]